MTNTNKNLDEGTALPAGVGVIPKNLAADLKEVNPFESIPTLTPGKPGLEAGATVGGYYVRTKRVYSDKFVTSKRDNDGRKYRDLHILRDVATGKNFGIWGVGQLDFTMQLVAPNQLIEITYEGKAEKALRPGESPAHSFSFRGVDATIDAEKLAMMEAGVVAPAAAAAHV